MQALEEANEAGAHIVQLLTQADQALLQFKVALSAFREAHHLNDTPAAQIEEALKDVESALAHATEKHNEVVAQLNEAKGHVAQLPSDDPGY